VSENQETSGSDASSGTPCANCGAPLTGPFCAACGQSQADLRRPALSLVTDFLDGAIAWDGLFLTTFRGLYLRPGRVARDYVEGKRARYSSPVRIYLIMTLILFAMSAAAGIRPIAITLSPDGDSIRNQTAETIAARRLALQPVAPDNGDESEASIDTLDCGVMPGPDEIAADGSLVFARDTAITFALFQRGQVSEPRTFNTETAACFARSAESLRGRWNQPIILEASLHPAAYEARAAAIASQVFLFMVAGFALLNLALHPRRPVIEHIVYSFYWHAGLVPGLLLLILAIDLGENNVLSITLAGGMAVAIPIFAALQERGFYGSSWIGTALRLPALLFGYATIQSLVAISLILLGAR
tara:strand:+ start:83 stop:1156 length:1074 start_codon:yes stop_codon:yes gene_type:complete